LMMEIECEAKKMISPAMSTATVDSSGIVMIAPINNPTPIAVSASP
jgi:hypothetical protein